MTDITAIEKTIMPIAKRYGVKKVVPVQFRDRGDNRSEQRFHLMRRPI